MNVPPGEYSQAMLNKFNEDNKGYYFVNVSETDSHFMTAESTCVMYECLFKDAFRMQRKRWNLDATCRGALQCDDFNGNRAEKEGHASKRDQFSRSVKRCYASAEEGRVERERLGLRRIPCRVSQAPGPC